MATARRPRPSVMRLTEAAAARVRDLVEAADRPIAGVRVGVKKGGCAGMEYTLEPVEMASPMDDVVSDHGATVFIDPKAVMFLLGSEMDFETTKLRSGFVFRNPNEVSAAAAVSRSC